MEITFKTLTQESFKLELQPSEKISDVKERISKERGEAVEQQKLLYNGKVLEDGNTVEECGIDPARFVVLMVTKPKVELKPEEKKTELAPVAAPTSTPSSTPASVSAESTPAAGSDNLTAEQQAAVTAITGMGYQRDQALAALQAANFNANAAVDFLMGGLEEAAEPRVAAGAALAPGIIEAASGVGRGRSNPAIENPLSALRGPQFDELRAMVRQNPDMLPEVLQQIAATNPDLMNAIAQNQGEFARMLNEMAEGEESGSDEDDGDEEMDEGGRDMEPEDQLRQRGVARIRVTPEDNAAIDRLKGMGFPEPLVIEAFFACDKDEGLAVNYILQRMDEAADAFNE